MALSLTDSLRPWLASMEGVDWLNVRANGLYSMWYLRNIRLRPELLRAAVSFWDPEVHVFRFGDQELCLTVEEFRAYLGGFGSGEVIIPPVSESIYRVLAAALGLGDGAARYLVRDGRLNVMRLIELFSPPRDLADVTYQTRCMTALCMCLLAAYLLVLSARHTSSALVSVAVHVEARKDAIPMVLAETLIGLDKVCFEEIEAFGGSALLLQVGFSLSSPFPGFLTFSFYLNTRLGFLKFLTCFLSSHRFGFAIRSMAEWVDFFRRQRAETISWRCRWLGLPPMTVHYMGPQWVVLAGLGAFTFYIRYRIQRQLGLRQEAPAEVLVDVVLPLFRHSVLCHYQRFWRMRKVTDAHPYPSVAVCGSYRKWLRREIAARAGAQGN
ncbi:hypothetical protein RHMOL_Rhmol11G0048300 [Rhododendron molle]|uniref:Uncharacterized protein n=1 Tax=Rhododendron molle TaxID=49168 RepID=A0ACC0LNY2_RHOML|nr:hypothetical protein RHMOL_Rhmol11G0048300 [Rhododendron molle]